MLEGAAETPHDRFAGVDRGRSCSAVAADFPKPFVVALDGDVYGVATSVILMADALVSTPGVKISDPHVHMGLVAGDGGVVAWPANLATTLAKRHLLWGEPLLAEDAHRVGVVTDLVGSRDDVRGRAEELAARVAALPPVAVQLTKRALNQTVAVEDQRGVRPRLLPRSRHAGHRRHGGGRQRVPREACGSLEGSLR